MDNGKSEDRFARAKELMLKQDLMGRDITNPEVLEVMAEIPREQFIPEAYKSQAYSDCPLPIGLGQTISQPYIVALMTQELRVNRDCDVLEIGTGSGYQTAVLCKLVKKVYTVERFAELSERAVATLRELNIKNVEFYVGDGSCGWPEEKEFDRIMITASVPEIPEPLIRQLKEGGLIVAPVGPAGVQDLEVCEKKKDKMLERSICGCRFVKLLGKYGFEQ
ncbi:MAG: protein-L-isoaspartate(D-aspartate) O-methyltransferase [Planctomycetota bacterium]|jgi:protein-L-isoaspartate(D-aspartate) O-methyltransferase